MSTCPRCIAAQCGIHPRCGGFWCRLRRSSSGGETSMTSRGRPPSLSRRSRDAAVAVALPSSAIARCVCGCRQPVLYVNNPSHAASRAPKNTACGRVPDSRESALRCEPEARFLRRFDLLYPCSNLRRRSAALQYRVSVGRSSWPSRAGGAGRPIRRSALEEGIASSGQANTITTSDSFYGTSAITSRRQTGSAAAAICLARRSG